MCLPCIATHVGGWWDLCGWEQAMCGARTWATYNVTLAPWYPLGGRLGLTCPNQLASHWARTRSSDYLSCHYLSVSRRWDQSWPGWWASWVRVAASPQWADLAFMPRTCLNPLLSGFMRHRVYLLCIPSVSRSEDTNCSSILKLVYTI